MICNYLLLAASLSPLASAICSRTCLVTLDLDGLERNMNVVLLWSGLRADRVNLKYIDINQKEDRTLYLRVLLLIAGKSQSIQKRVSCYDSAG